MRSDERNVRERTLHTTGTLQNSINHGHDNCMCVIFHIFLLFFFYFFFICILLFFLEMCLFKYISP